MDKNLHERRSLSPAEMLTARPTTAGFPPSAVLLPQQSGLKRAFDVVGAVLLLFASAPMWALAAIAIRLESPGPVFFRQKRIGKGGVPFMMYKFRKMPEDLPVQGPMLTRRSDPRLSRVGSLLERTKLDELPQLLNVLRGEMSLIGPRPEVEKFVDLGDPRWQLVLSARPGLFGISQIQGRNEASLYPEDCEDLEAFYRENILPDKLVRDGGYVREASVPYDFKLLIQGILVSAFGTVTGSSLHAHGPQVIMLVVDLMASVFSMGLARFLRFGQDFAAIPEIWTLLWLCAASRASVFLVMGIYRRRPHTLTTTDLLRILKSVLYGSALYLTVAWIAVGPRASEVILVDALVLTAFLMAKAYSIQEVLNSYVKHKLHWSATRSIVAAGVGAMTSAAMFMGMLIAWRPFHDSMIIPPIQYAWLLIAYLAIRGYGLYRYSLLAPAPKWGILTDLGRILGGTTIGTLLIYLADAVFFSDLLPLHVLLADLAISMMVITVVRRLLWATEHTLNRPVESNGEGPAKPQMLLVGAGPGAEFYLSYLERVTGARPPVLGVLDSQTLAPRAQTINGVRVLGGFAQLRAILESRDISQVVYFPEEVDADQKVEMRAICDTYETSMTAFPDLMNLPVEEPRPSTNGESQRVTQPDGNGSLTRAKAREVNPNGEDLPNPERAPGP